MNTCEIEENTEVDDEYISQSFVVRPDTGNMAHRAMEKLLKMADGDTNIHWRSLLVDESPLHSIADFQSALDEALKQKFVKYILIQHPRQYPAFIRDDDKAQGVN
ncbi:MULTISPECIES: hypothetical protein [Pseudomonas]|nr:MULTISPECIES: hypothetical protein [Pseudomonas]